MGFVRLVEMSPSFKLSQIKSSVSPQSLIDHYAVKNNVYLWKTLPLIQIKMDGWRVCFTSLAFDTLRVTYNQM